MAAETKLLPSTNKHDLIPLDYDNRTVGELQLELTLGIQIFSKVVTPTYRFKLHAVQLSEMDVVNARVRVQDEEVRELRSTIDSLSTKLRATTATTFSSDSVSDTSASVYFCAETTETTTKNQLVTWKQPNRARGFCLYQPCGSKIITFVHEGLYSIHIVVHHTSSSSNPNDHSAFWHPWSVHEEVYHLQKNGGSKST